MEHTPKNLENEPQIEILRAKPEDAESIQEVFYQVWRTTYPNEKAGVTKDDIEDRFKNRNLPEVLAKRKERLANPPVSETTFVAKDEEKIVGVCRVDVDKKENRLSTIYILPEYQHKGIGLAFWEQALGIFDLSKDTFVNVATYNEQAQTFYKKLGFVDTGKVWENEKFRMKSGTIIPEMEMVIKKKVADD